MSQESKVSVRAPRGVSIRGPVQCGFEEILTPEALKFLAALHREFETTRQGLLRLREKRQVDLDNGVKPTYLKHTQWIRDSDWKGPYIPADLADRRVEITGPVDRKMVINALNSGAKVFMADFEDSSCPTWSNMLDGQINMRDAIRRTISFTNSRNGKQYKLKSSGLATLMVRPRGWHLDEAHIEVDGLPMSGSLVDFGLYFFHNAEYLLNHGSGPYFYLAKLESHLEARLWNSVFNFAQNYCNVPRGSIRATVLLETIMAAFEMDEILFELREHSAGMNCGRWDYIFSFIKRFRNWSDMVLPDRAQVGMNKPFMSNYVSKVIQTCHRRGVHAMGGMAAQIPVKNNPAANNAAIQKVRNDKLREVKAGHDGTWVAHPALIKVAMDVFNDHMPTPHQIHVSRDDVKVSDADLLDIGSGGDITEQGLIGNISVGLHYIEAWLRGVGCIPYNNLMEDAATAEISRSQIWQWLRHGAQLTLATGSRVAVTRALVTKYLDAELDKIKDISGAQAYNQRKWAKAGELYADMLFSENPEEFLTLKAYPYIKTLEPATLSSSL